MLHDSLPSRYNESIYLAAPTLQPRFIRENRVAGGGLLDTVLPPGFHFGVEGHSSVGRGRPQVQELRRCRPGPGARGGQPVPALRAGPGGLRLRRSA